MKNINTYIIEKFQISKDVKTSSLDLDLNEDDMNYKFKVSETRNKGIPVKRIFDAIIKNYPKKNEKELRAELKQEIIIDKLLYDNNFGNTYNIKHKIKTKDEDLNAFFIETDINKYGYIIIYNAIGYKAHVWNFLVTRPKTKVGKTLIPIELIEPKEYEDDIHKYGILDEVKRTLFNIDEIEKAWKYIEDKYGKF